jgi:hypothetical protein
MRTVLGKDRMRAVVGKENLVSLFSFWRNHVEGRVEQTYWTRSLRRPKNRGLDRCAWMDVLTRAYDKIKVP